MSVKSGSTLIDVPQVNNAVEHLQELGLRMSKDEFGFSEDDMGNVDLIIDAVRDLENECSKLHEKLETETINASVLRHKLLYFPAEIRKQIQDAVNAARQSNADELNRLQTSLDGINNNIGSLEKQHTQLEKENAVMHPERDRVRQEHEEIIARLNQRMAEKASKQIVLNETRDKLRETNQKIVDLEEGIIQLKEDLIQERADARMEKKRLKKAVYDTTMKTREQKETNISKKKELDELHEKVMDSEGQLDYIRKNIRRFETSRSRLDGQERALAAQLSKELKHNDDLRLKGADLNRKLGDQEDAFEKKKADLEETLKELDAEMQEEEDRNNDLDVTKMELESELADKMKVRRFDEVRVKEQNEGLQKTKQELAWKAEDVARLRSENSDMEVRVVELDETHEAIVSTLHKQIEEMRETLAKERKERMELQDQRDNVQNDIDVFKIETTKYMSEVNRQITEGKQEHDNLTKEGTTLQKALREDEATIQRLQDHVTSLQRDYKTKVEEEKRQVQNMEGEIVSMEEGLKSKEDSIQEQLPAFQALESFFEERSASYEASKKELVAMKNKKLGLEDSVKRGNRDLGKMANPKSELEKDLRRKREENLSHMKTDADDLRAIERDIYTVGCKLSTTLEENTRFLKANQDYDAEIDNLKMKMTENDKTVGTLNEELEKMKGALMGEWQSDRSLEKDYADRDQVVVDELGSLLDKTGKREQVINDITTKLQSELGILSEFLENVARRRPKVKSSGMSRSAKSPSARRSHSPGRVAMDYVADGNTNVARATTPSGRITVIVPSTAAGPKIMTPRPPDTARSKKSQDGVGKK